MGSTQSEGLANEVSKDAQVPLTAADKARLAATIDNWKRRLLDVTKRNRALNFRPNKVTSITVIDEQPAEVFRQLSLQGQQMRFRPAPQESTAPLFSGDAPAQEQAEEVVDEFGLALDFVPYDATS